MDSFQIVAHTEFYAHTAHHELVLLRQAECQRLTPFTHGLMCGATPALRNCTDDDEALRRMDVGCGPIAEDQWNAGWRYSEPLEKLNIGPGPNSVRFPACHVDSSGCYAEANGTARSIVWCPHDLHRRWRDITFDSDSDF